LNILDVTIERNAYGRQLSSHIDTGQIIFPKNVTRDCEMVFIRAPKITRLGANVQVFAYQNDLPVGVIGDRCMITTFHPELSQDTAIHQYFVDQIKSSLYS
jgi:5'-phosphate synthase pdxT subunit